MIKIYKTGNGIILGKGEQFYESSFKNWDELINLGNIHEVLEKELGNLQTAGGVAWLASQKNFGSHRFPGGLGCWCYLPEK